MKIYTYSDLSAPYLTITPILAESILEADEKAKVLGVNVMRTSVAIGVKLVIIDTTVQPKLVGHGKLVNEFSYPKPVFISDVFDNEHDLVKAHKRFLKVAMYNPHLQFFWQVPTSHHYKLHTHAGAEVRAVIEALDDAERLQRQQV